MSDDSPARKRKEDLNCFVVIGFGRKTDFATGRVLDLDLTHTKLIKPAFDRVGINCFRAIDVNRSGSIDKIMYHWIYHADIVVADLSTMNANVMYELGVRHAQQPNTSIIIAENDSFKRLPFDLSHTVIHGYEHLGEEIADDEAKRFVDHLATLVQSVLDKPIENDSPIYTYMEGMSPPTYVAPAERIKQLEAQLRGETATEAGEDVRHGAVSVLVKQAEEAKNAKEFDRAIGLLDESIRLMEKSDEDEAPATDGQEHREGAKEVFLYQRKALCTYKRTEKNASDDDDANAAAKADLHAAMAILDSADNPRRSNDPETLGLAGAINKRLWERTRDVDYLDLSIEFYERGFYIAQDYYNGINVAYMYTVKADEASDPFDATVNYGHALLLRKKVAEVCEAIIDADGFEKRGDKQWIYMTLAEAHLGRGQEAEVEQLLPKIAQVSKGPFDMDTFKNQQANLLAMMSRFETRTATTTATGARAAGPPGGAQTPARSAPGAVRAAAQRGTVVIDLGDDRPPKSLDVHCKVEY